MAGRADRLVLAPGPAAWMPWPPKLPRLGAPRATFRDRGRDGVEAAIAWGFVSLRAHAAAVDGDLSVRLLNGRRLGLERPTHDWVDRFNAHFAEIGRALHSVEVHGGSAVLTAGPR